MFLGLLFFSFVLHLGDFASFQAIVLWEKSKDFMQWNGIGLLIMKCLKIPFKIVSLLSCLLCISMYMTQNCFIVWVRFLFYAWMVHRSVLSFQQKNKKTPPNLKVFCFKMIQESLASWRHNINNWEVACDLCTVLYDSFTGFHFLLPEMQFDSVKLLLFVSACKITCLSEQTGTWNNLCVHLKIKNI